jgi:hypothetical protein
VLAFASHEADHLTDVAHGTAAQIERLQARLSELREILGAFKGDGI